MITIATPEAMHQLGLQISTHLRAGDLVLVNGPLGAGKTVLAQGVGAGLGVTGVASPTFVISRVHKAAIPFIHVDAYRLVDSENPNLYVDDLDLDVANSITLIEWGGDESARLSEDRLEITIDRSNDERTVVIKAVGTRWAGFSL
ncbi:MAG: tRNA (adenosine(37)-N6)-threonylcarbamoyltransferase complex ATPase subunit type 1 TsaE [Candidatus Planktophila sp.]|uniref:tRNA threonylcarbamoyladenosine biosynthesis protein TsaE n=1 Tax=freshwater metagenome TaxID=449393 RepID=A0A094Q8X7_9ZZZZ|nr:tRNA (adenosine(37)-N6)-threonylcarbamoyltransferase complex ATPase subunit type 1 TsaE [Candidatus Planktophila sp.]